jgi:acyl-[acyl-carrier-protein]-phospholipid O-acyltransferase/long-chain-fatty-acid--[acyl-carrier-protein] ligase
MSDHLLFTKRFAPLFWCQFFAAFNDNFLKNALVLLILFKIGGSAGESLVTLAGAVFIAPYFFLSALGGQIADKFDKAMVARRLKAVEVGAALIAVAGFALSSVPILFAALFSFGVLGALFGPVKYGILPDHLRREELPAGNALVEGATFLAILIGTIAGGLAMRRGGEPLLTTIGVVAASVAAWGAACYIPATARAAPDIAIDPNVLRSTAALLGELWKDKRLRRIAAVTSLFWLVGAIAMSLLAPLVTRTMHGSELVVTLFLAVFAIAIAIGSGIASFLLAGRIILLPAAIGAAIISGASIDLGAALSFAAPSQAAELLDIAEFLAEPGAWRVTIDLALLAMAGGLMIVPSFAAVQAYAPAFERARIIAAVNVLNAAFMAFGTLAVAMLQSGGVTVPMLFLGIGVLMAFAAVWIYKAVVASPFRDALSIIFRAFYRLEVKGLDNFDRAGENPIVALNHVSFLDAAAILCVLPIDPIFAIDSNIAQKWWVRPFLKFVRIIPLDPTRPLGTRTLVNAVRNGEPLVIFPEGRLTVTGSLMKVYDGAGLIAEKSGAWIVPVRIEGPEATMFSRLTREQARRRFFQKFTLTVLEPTRLVVDDALRGKARRIASGAALYEIMSDLVFRTSPIDRTLHQALVDAAREHGFGRVAIQDPINGALTYRRLLIGAHALGHKIRKISQTGEAVGIMLPNSNAVGVAIFAVVGAGRVAAMVNFTAGPANIRASLSAAKATTVLTSRAFVEKGKLDKLIAALEEDFRIVYLEDVRGEIGLGDKLSAFLRHRRALETRSPDDPAAVLFTSGSEGAPKGVVLSHKNLLANSAQASARIDFGRTDKLFSVLPVFHCFGLNVGLLLPLVSGVPIYFYPSPLHYKLVPELVYASNSTVLLGTDTFLTGYARVAHSYDFRSLRYVIAGAEPVKQRTRDVYSEKFGIRILEGYGVTETAPALALNTPMFNKFGTVGRLLPGMELQLQPVAGADEGGRLLVRGPNVMLGYLMVDKPGVLQPPAGGWHDTGDIVAVDAQGFIAIKGRAKRFAKIGGEMISLAAVEALASDLWPKALSAAARELDSRKGERIVLATQQADANRADFLAFAKARGASELTVPAEFMIVESLPLLGSGKLDFAAVDRLVRDRDRYILPTPRVPNGVFGRIDGGKIEGEPARTA